MADATKNEGGEVWAWPTTEEPEKNGKTPGSSKSDQKARSWAKMEQDLEDQGKIKQRDQRAIVETELKDWTTYSYQPYRK